MERVLDALNVKEGEETMNKHLQRRRLAVDVCRRQLGAVQGK